MQLAIPRSDTRTNYIKFSINNQHDFISLIQASYPARVRRTLMELNRSVCIDMPEAGVPWFHEKYCIEQTHSSKYNFVYSAMAKIYYNLAKVIITLFPLFAIDPPVSTSFHEDIYKCLVQVLGDDHFIKKWVYSAYYHLIGMKLTALTNGTLFPLLTQRARFL